MEFSKEQINLLSHPLNSCAVSTREQSGRTLSYIEGHHAIREANRIFGFDGWERQTDYCKEICKYETLVGKYKDDGWKVGYEAKVSVTAGGVTRQGTGHGQGISKDLFDAIEGAAKEAETDAMKRALMTFGDQFGLALYDKEQRHVASAQEIANRNKSVSFTNRALAELEGVDLPRRSKWQEENADKLTYLKKNHADLYNDIINKIEGN